MCPFPLKNAGIFADKFSLVKLDDPPEEQRGAPREQYARVYHVISREATWEQAQEIFSSMQN